MKCEQCKIIRCEDCGQIIGPKEFTIGDPPLIPWFDTNGTTGTIPNPGTNK